MKLCNSCKLNNEKNYTFQIIFYFRVSVGVFVRLSEICAACVISVLGWYLIFRFLKLLQALPHRSRAAQIQRQKRLCIVICGGNGRTLQNRNVEKPTMKPDNRAVTGANGKTQQIGNNKTRQTSCVGNEQ